MRHLDLLVFAATAVILLACAIDEAFSLAAAVGTFACAGVIVSSMTSAPRKRQRTQT